MLLNGLLSVLLAVPAAAHIVMWNEGMYGFEAGHPEAKVASYPLRDEPFKKWWFHGFMDQPPEAGKFLELPSGGVYHGEVACVKALTTWGQGHWRPTYLACGEGKNSKSNSGALHTTDRFNVSDPVAVKGCGLSIAYESDPNKVKPEDFVVLSVNHSCPWRREVDFEIPAGLPPCPPGGCHCMWGWIPTPDETTQTYLAFYRCNVVNPSAQAKPLPAAQIARKCPFVKANCTRGAKQMLYADQKEGNNYNQSYFDPPFYNADYGFEDGAQHDIWQLDDGKTWVNETAPGPEETLTKSFAITPDSRPTVHAAPPLDLMLVPTLSSSGRSTTRIGGMKTSSNQQATAAGSATAAASGSATAPASGSATAPASGSPAPTGSHSIAAAGAPTPPSKPGAPGGPQVNAAMPGASGSASGSGAGAGAGAGAATGTRAPGTSPTDAKDPLAGGGYKLGPNGKKCRKHSKRRQRRQQLRGF